MSYFGQALEVALKRKGIKATDLAQATGIYESKISRWIRRSQSFVDMADLKSVCVALSDDAPALVLAHLKDSCPEQYQYLLNDAPTSGYLMHEAPVTTTKFDDALAVLRQHGSTDADVRALILDLARLFRPRTPGPAGKPAGKGSTRFGEMDGPSKKSSPGSTS